MAQGATDAAKIQNANGFDGDGDEALVSIAQDERNDVIPKK